MEPHFSIYLCGFFVLYACVVLSGGDIRDSLNNWEILTVSGIQRWPVKRDTTGAQPAKQLIKFNAFGRHFALFLRKNLSILAPEFKIFVFAANGSRNEVQLDLSLYKGYVEGDENSFVSAYFDDQQVLSASIQTSEETFMVEPATNLIPNSSNETMIIYKGSDLKWGNSSRCGYVRGNKNSGVMNKSISENRLLARTRKAVCTSSKDTCPLYLSADPPFVREVGKNDVKKTAEIMAYSINWVDNIFRNTDFPGCGKNFGFSVKLVNIFKTFNPKYPYTDERRNYEAGDFLGLFGKDKEKEGVCLGHLFTCRSFNNRIIGLANMGAVCSSEGVGWSTYGEGEAREDEPKPNLMGMITTAHEIGHNWGTDHDPDSNEECFPKSAAGGVYIMTTTAASGLDKNNDKFSRCSRAAIGEELSKSSSCFEARKLDLCGNSIIETGEQCDPGSTGNHKCCDNNCKFKPNAVCSNEACCTEDCQVIRDTSYVCFTPSGEGCVSNTTCDGVNSKCPAGSLKPDEAPCSRKGKCLKGKCIPLCQQNNYESCMCDTMSDACKRCCRNNDGQCSPLLINGTFEHLAAGMGCVGGMCDREGICQSQVADFVKRLGNFLDLSSPGAFTTFMKNNFTVTIIILSLLVYIPASCYICYLDRRDKKNLKRRQKTIKTSNID